MKSTDNSQHYLLDLDFWVVDVDASAFFQQILGDGDACRLSAFMTTVTTDCLCQKNLTANT